MTVYSLINLPPKPITSDTNVNINVGYAKIVQMSLKLMYKVVRLKRPNNHRSTNGKLVSVNLGSASSREKMWRSTSLVASSISCLNAARSPSNFNRDKKHTDAPVTIKTTIKDIKRYIFSYKRGKRVSFRDDWV